MRADGPAHPADSGVVLSDVGTLAAWLEAVPFGVAFIDRDLRYLLVNGAVCRMAVLAGLSGYSIDVARQPPPPGLATVRAFQRAHGVATLAWLRRRLGS